jgi:F-type H+-transporting ATPase subunit delta
MLKEADTKTRKINITSHKEYTSDDRSEILLALKNKFNFDDTSEANFSVDPNIMGGIKVRIGNKIIDGSVATKLKKIKQSLLGI